MVIVWRRLHATWQNQGSLHTKILGSLQNTVHWCNLTLAQERSLHLSNTITCNRPQQHTASGLHWEGGMHEDWGRAIPQSISISKVARVILKPNSQSGQQDQHEQEARKSSDHQSVSGSFCETRSGNVDTKEELFHKVCITLKLQHWYLRTLRNLFQKTMHRLSFSERSALFIAPMEDV